MLQEGPFPIFWDKYTKSLDNFTLYRFKYLVLGKTYVSDVRQNCLRSNEFALQHDFTEALGIKHNQEIQSSHFGGSLSVSIEGYTCHYRSDGMDSPLKCDFHSYMSDESTQNSATVYCHMTKLCNTLVNDLKLLTRGTGRLLTGTDGAAKQYKSSTSIYFMTLLATTFEIVVDRAIACPGHGKSTVDSQNGVDKNTILRWSNRRVQSPDEALDSKASAMQVHSFNNTSDGKVYSAAADCKRILEQIGSEGVKSEGKRAKREMERGFNNRYWHVRPASEKLFTHKCATIQIPNPNLSFKDMYHYYTCPDLDTSVAALRQVPCNCNSCDEKIRLPWDSSVEEDKDQPRFGMVHDCYFNSILEDSNCWYIVKLVLKDGEEDDVDEAHQEVLHHVTTAIAQNVVVGEIGAVATVDEDALDGYFLFEFTSLPYTDQAAGVLKCDGNWLYSLPQAKNWFTKSVVPVSVDLLNVVLTGVSMMAYSPGNMPPSRANKGGSAKDALKLCVDSHNFILDEITRRERLEYDPDRVYVGQEREEELESDSESENDN